MGPPQIFPLGGLTEKVFLVRGGVGVCPVLRPQRPSRVQFRLDTREKPHEYWVLGPCNTACMTVWHGSWPPRMVMMELLQRKPMVLAPSYGDDGVTPKKENHENPSRGGGVAQSKLDTREKPHEYWVLGPFT